MKFPRGHRHVLRRITVLFSLAASLAAGGAVPAWLLDEIRNPAPIAAGEKGAVVLRSENVITVATDGTWQEVYRYAVRVERPDGADLAVIGAPYLDGADTVLRAEAWLLRDGKLVKAFPRKEWLDRAEVDGATLYSDFRLLLLGAPLAASGDVFGGEILVRKTANAGQAEISFSLPLAARLQRLEVRAPKQWTIRLAWLHGRGVAPAMSVDNNTASWEVRDQPEVRREFWAPDEPLLRAALTISPPAGVPGPVPPVPATWQEVAAGLAAIQQAQCDTNAGLAQTARRLTAGLDDPWKKIQALTRFVQERRYIAVNRNTGLGFGYCPRKATTVLEADYGDCKDKSNLLKALLREAGFRAYLVAAYVGDPQAVRPEWPSPVQFNHAIVAIELPVADPVPAALEVPGFGRLLFFDSTARWIPAGHLPWPLQGGWGLICDPRAEGLVQFPLSAEPDEFKVATHVTLTLDAGGACQGEAVETVRGQLAAARREAEDAASASSQRNFWSHRLNAAISGAVVDTVAGETAADAWGHTTTVRFNAADFGQPFRGGLRLYDLDILRPDITPVFPDRPRQHEVLIQPACIDQDVSLNLPPGSVPEIPAAKHFRNAFGEFTGNYELQSGRIVYRRSLRLNPGRVPPEKYPEYRQFLTEIAKAGRTALIVRLADPPPATTAEAGPAQ